MVSRPGIIGERSPSKGLASAIEAPSRRHRVLVVDDEEAVGEGLRMLLEQEYAVELAPGGRKALEMFSSREPFDAVLCDLMMPGMSGIELFHVVKATYPGLERRIVFMTGGAFTPEAEAFLDAVANNRVEKPFDFANVDRLLRHVLESAGRD